MYSPSLFAPAMMRFINGSVVILLLKERKEVGLFSFIKILGYMID
jgi:hypothetical protein